MQMNVTLTQSGDSYLYVEPMMQVITASGMRWVHNKAKRNIKISNIVFSVFML